MCLNLAKHAQGGGLGGEEMLCALETHRGLFPINTMAGHQLERLRLITSLHSDHQIWCGWETVTILWWLYNLLCPIMVLFKHSMANRQMRFDMCDNYPNALGKCFTMLSLAGRPTRLSSIFQRPENRAIYYVVSWDISIFFFIVQSILWHDNGSINPRRQSDKWWGLRFWSW